MPRRPVITTIRGPYATVDRLLLAPARVGEPTPDLDHYPSTALIARIEFPGYVDSYIENETASTASAARRGAPENLRLAKLERSRRTRPDPEQRARPRDRDQDPAAAKVGARPVHAYLTPDDIVRINEKQAWAFEHFSRTTTHPRQPVDLIRDRLASGQRGGRGGGGGVADVDGVSVRWTTKSSTSLPSRPRAWARMPAGPGVALAPAQGGDHAGRLGDEGGGAGGVPHLDQACAPVVAHHLPGARPAKVSADVAAAGVGEVVGVAGGRHQGARADQHVAGEVAGEVGAEEGQVGVRHGVDVGADQLRLGRTELQVAAAEGDDAGVGGAPQATARRSDQRPAQKTAWAATVRPRECSIASLPPPAARRGRGSRGGASRPPPRRRPRKSWRRRRSRRPRCAGECRAATPRAFGSISAISSPRGAAARAPRSASRAVRARPAARVRSSSRDHELARLAVGIPCSSQ